MNRGKDDDGDSGSGLFSASLFRVGRPGGKRRGRRPITPQAESPGSVIADGPGTDALDGKLPLFIVHKPRDFYQSVFGLLDRLQADSGGRLALGVSSWLPSGAADSHLAFNAACDAAAIRIVDPRGYRADGQGLRVKKPSDQEVERAPYLADGAFPAADLLELQRVCGANLLLTSGRTLSQSDALASLAAACDEGDEALAALRPGERLALNLTASAEWLRDEQLRDDLLAELIEKRQFGVWYVRVQWPSQAWRQPADDKLIDGYRKLAETASDQGRCLLLPQTGLTGWLTLAWGTTGFGTGATGSLQAFREESDGGGGNRPRVERYFERQLLHFAERTAHHALTGDRAYQQCTCPYCGPLLAAHAWSHNDAGLHYLHSTAMLAAEAAPAAAGGLWARDAVADRVRGAAAFASGKPLTGHSNPAHLRTWDQLL